MKQGETSSEAGELGGFEGREELHLRLFKASTQPIGSNWDTQNVNSSFWRFYYNDVSGAEIEWSGGTFGLDGGKCYFLPAGLRFNCRNATNIRHFYVHFEILGLSGIVMQEMFSSPVEIGAKIEFVEKVRTLSAKTVGNGGLDFGLESRLKAVIYEALALCFEELPYERQDQFARLTASISDMLPAIHHIEAELGSTISNFSLSKICCMSENHFIRRFKERLGQTPAKYIQERRLAKAGQRLLFTSESIEKIAEETGFGNRFYLTRVFSRHFKLSPAAYRKRARV